MAEVASHAQITHNYIRQISTAGALLAATFFILVLSIGVSVKVGAVEDDTSTSQSPTQGGSGNAVAPPGAPAPYKTPSNDVSVNWSWAAASVDTTIYYEYAVVPEGQTPDAWMSTSFTSVSTTVPGEGTYRLYLRTATDDGQYSDIVSGVVTIDTTAPTATIDSPAPAVVGGTALFQGTLLDFRDMTLTVGSRIVTLSDGTYEPQTGRWTIRLDTSNFAPGVYRITLFARDDAGNSSTSTSELRITAPAAPIVASASTPPPTLGATPHASSIVPATINPGAFQAVLTDAGIAPSPATQGVVGTRPAPTVSPVETTVTQTINSDANQGRFVGLAWYWWLLMLSAVAAVGWGISKWGAQPVQYAPAKPMSGSNE